MAETLFVSQAQLETWIDQGMVTFSDNVLTLATTGAAYVLEPAARVTALLDGTDVREWVGTVVVLAVLEAQGAEHLHDSILVGETAYRCESGFLGELQETTSADRGLLEDFLLKSWD